MLEHLQGPPYANQVVQKGTQGHTAGLYISTSQSGSGFTSSLILPSPREYQRIRTSFYSTFSLVIFKTGTDHASKSLQEELEMVARLKTSQCPQIEFYK